MTSSALNILDLNRYPATVKDALFQTCSNVSVKTEPVTVGGGRFFHREGTWGCGSCKGIPSGLLVWPGVYFLAIKSEQGYAFW